VLGSFHIFPKDDTMVQFLTGKDYPHLCQYCQEAIDDMAYIIKYHGEDTDDTEAPVTRAYDYDMLCGGNVCLESEAYKAQGGIQ